MAFEKFKKIKFTARTASAGTKFKPYYQGISRILKTGGQSKGQGGFFDYKRAAKNPDKYHVEVDEATGERATYIERNEYTEQMLTRGVGGAPMTNVEALRAKKGFVKDDPKTLVDNLGNLFGLGDILKAGGYSSLPGGAFAPYQVPKSVQEATEQIKDESTNIFQVPGEVVNGGSISKINEVISDVPKIQDSDSALAQNIPAKDQNEQ